MVHFPATNNRGQWRFGLVPGIVALLFLAGVAPVVLCQENVAEEQSMRHRMRDSGARQGLVDFALQSEYMLHFHLSINKPNAAMANYDTVMQLDCNAMVDKVAVRMAFDLARFYVGMGDLMAAYDVYESTFSLGDQPDIRLRREEIKHFLGDSGIQEAPDTFGNFLKLK